jgi:hypothetical protein
MNEKGGMNDEEFERYINNIIIPLFPDMEDMPGKHVLLKVDSGPGCNCKSLLVSCWQCGGAYQQRAGGAAEVEGRPRIQMGNMASKCW